MLKSLFHTGFIVRDIEKSVQFYTEVLGMRMAGRMEFHDGFIEQVLAFPQAHIKGGFVDTGEGHQLELIQYVSPESGSVSINRNDLGAAHLAFFVEDIDRFYAATSDKGLDYLNPPAPLEGENGKVVYKVCYAQDPDGNWLEFVEAF